MPPPAAAECAAQMRIQGVASEPAISRIGGGADDSTAANGLGRGSADGSDDPDMDEAAALRAAKGRRRVVKKSLVSPVVLDLGAAPPTQRGRGRPHSERTGPVLPPLDIWGSQCPVPAVVAAPSSGAWPQLTALAGLGAAGYSGAVPGSMANNPSFGLPVRQVGACMARQSLIWGDLSLHSRAAQSHPPWRALPSAPCRLVPCNVQARAMRAVSMKLL
ncbi:hypothetical protein PLESTB_001421100 [Pleodorina starrii]|uniref:Uncharacterized protein n=1 Tax=Pleodorina starrii TaxID=330485 RepID=A0A9W6BV22_9CHLO|nr:hypothetical protein PLESTB_001421100 [Pleodorina starrii]